MLVTRSIDGFRLVPLALAVVFMFAPQVGVAQSADPWQEGGPSRGEDLSIRLLTFSPGDDIASWFGHTALHVRDSRLNVDRVYNYGMFSFGSDMLPKFLMGRLEFWVGRASYERTIKLYESLDRSIRVQELNILPEKRLEIARFLAWNVRPENRHYLYDHYNDNCATRIRDVIDRATDGQFAKANDVEGRYTFREHTRRHTQRNPYIDVLLTYWMNSKIDRPIKQWDEMFLPTELERQVDALRFVDSSGQEVPLVVEKETLYASPTRAPAPESPSVFWPWALAFGLAFGGVAYAMSFQWRRRPERRRWRILLGIHTLVAGLLFGVPGLILVLFHLTEHTITHFNLNGLVANPLTFAALPLGIAIAFGSRRALRWMAWAWCILAVTSVLALVLMPFVPQDILIPTALLLPVNLLFAIGMWPLRHGGPTDE